MTLFFAKIHLGNFAYACAKSLFCPVQYASATVPKGWLKRFRAIYFEDCFSYDDWIRLRDDIWTEWAPLVDHVPIHNWNMVLFGRSIDFRRIALQHLGKEFLAHRRLVRYIERIGSEQAFISETMALRYLRTLAVPTRIDVDGKVGVARGGWIWDACYCWGRSVGWVVYLLLQMVNALRRWSGPDSTDVLHEGLSRSESGTGPSELSFSWIHERGICLPERILYVVGFPPKRSAPNILRRHEALRGLGWRVALRAICGGIGFVVMNWRQVAGLHGGLLLEFGMRSVAPYLLAVERGVRTYLTTLSASFPEHPSVAVYNALGIRTVIWAYSANFTLFNQRYLSAERNFFTAHLETRECWVWSEQHRTLWRRGEIGSQGPRFLLIGPTMMADASPCVVSSSESRRRFLGVDDEGANQPLIAVFDVNSFTKEASQTLQLGPLAISQEYIEVFYQHLIRLLDAFPNVRLLVKTKRGKHPLKTESAARMKLIDPTWDLVRAGRVIDLDPDINPYVPVGAADLTIGVPFTSPVQAGLYFGRRGIFHDPLGIALQHHYHGLDEIIAHGYDDLEKKVRYWLFECADEAFQAFLNRAETRRFLGPRPGMDPAEEFGKALWGEAFSLAKSDDRMVRDRDVSGQMLPVGFRLGT